MTPEPKKQDAPVDLQPKQMELLVAILNQAPDSPTVLGWGGSRGAAKSGGVRRVAYLLAGMEPCIIWIIRRVWDDLNKDHVKPFFIEQPHMLEHWHAGDKELKVPVKSGGTSSIFFVHAGIGGRAKRKARGPQARYIFLEQAEEFSQEEMEQLAGSNREPGVPPGVCKRIYTFNPGGIGTAYLRRIFHLREYMDNERPGDFLFTQAYGWDNYEWFRGVPGAPSYEDFYESPEWNDYKPFEYSGAIAANTSERRFRFFIEKTDFGKKLAALPQSQRIGELMGSFDKFAGQYYADVWEPSVIILPAAIVARIVQPWWRRWIATDWGFSHYAATGWAVSGILTPDQVLDLFGVRVEGQLRIIIVYRELVCCDVAEPDLAQLVSSMTSPAERREVRDYWLSPDAWQKRGGGNTVSEQIEPVLLREGLPRLSKAHTDRVGGWRLLYNCWAMARKLRKWNGPEQFRQMPEDPPCLFVSEACPEIAKAVPMLICKDEDPTDVRKVPGAIEDDVADMVRYLIKSYLDAEPGPPGDVIARETYAKYEDPTSRAMAMRKLEAELQRQQFLRRRGRA